MVLAKHGKTGILWDNDLARGGLKLAAEDTQECGFACAVCADDAVAVVGCEFEVNVLEKLLTCKGNADV